MKYPRTRNLPTTWSFQCSPLLSLINPSLFHVSTVYTILEVFKNLLWTSSSSTLSQINSSLFFFFPPKPPPSWYHINYSRHSKFPCNLRKRIVFLRRKHYHSEYISQAEKKKIYELIYNITEREGDASPAKVYNII